MKDTIHVDYSLKGVKGRERCIKDLKFKGELNFQSFFGLTAANEQSASNDIDVFSMKIVNLDPEFYVNDAGVSEENYFNLGRV